MTPNHGLAVHYCEQAEGALAAAEGWEAVAKGTMARSLVQPYPLDSIAAGLYIRGSLAVVDGLCLVDELIRAQGVAFDMVALAEWSQPGPKWTALAHLRFYETLEMQRQYFAAARGFRWLEAHLPNERWAASIKLACANHMLSIAVHNADPLLGAEGIEVGERVRALVGNPDDVSAWLQWRGIHESRRAQTEAMITTFEESFPLRADTPRRNITRGFLEAEIAFAESDSKGIAVLQRTIDKAKAAGLHRHARTATAHMARFFG